MVVPRAPSKRHKPIPECAFWRIFRANFEMWQSNFQCFALSTVTLSIFCRIEVGGGGTAAAFYKRPLVEQSLNIRYWSLLPEYKMVLEYRIQTIRTRLLNLHRTHSPAQAHRHPNFHWEVKGAALFGPVVKLWSGSERNSKGLQLHHGKAASLKIHIPRNGKTFLKCHSQGFAFSKAFFWMATDFILVTNAPPLHARNGK